MMYDHGTCMYFDHSVYPLQWSSSITKESVQKSCLPRSWCTLVAFSAAMHDWIRRHHVAFEQQRVFFVLYRRCRLMRDCQLQESVSFYESLLYRGCYMAYLRLGWKKHRFARVEGFHARCLRRVLGVSATFISQASNDTIYLKAGVKPLRAQLFGAQLSIFGKAAQAPSSANGSPDEALWFCSRLSSADD